MAPVAGPCGWDIPDPTCCKNWEAADQVEKDRAKRMAAWLLWTATGRQLGRCETTLRPCRRDCQDTWPPRCGGASVSAGRWFGSMSGDATASWGGGRCGCANSHSCSCTQVCEIDLPGWYPEPVEVRIDGWIFPLANFRMDNGRWLVWEQPCEPDCCQAPACDCGAPRYDCFPACQDLSKPPDCEGTWQITYLHGACVPEEGLWAGAELACEVLKACGGAGPGECRLPSNVVSLTRAQVSMQFADPGTVTTANGRTLRFNIPIVDMWVQAINPYGDTGPVTFFSPDVNAGRVQTWP